MLANIPYMDPMGKDFPFSSDLNFRFHVKLRINFGGGLLGLLKSDVFVVPFLQLIL